MHKTTILLFKIIYQEQCIDYYFTIQNLNIIDKKQKKSTNCRISRFLYNQLFFRRFIHHHNPHKFHLWWDGPDRLRLSRRQFLYR